MAEQMTEQPKKRKKIQKYHRQRAHVNPLSDLAPTSPDDVDWDVLYPDRGENEVKFVDVGCGYGGTTFALAKMFPETLVLGLEIRQAVTEYVRQKLEKLRGNEDHMYTNAAVILCNAMKYITNYFKKGQLEKMFFLFADPHFKKANFRRRIINPELLAEYAYLLKVGGVLYSVTDVLDLHQWNMRHLDDHPLFERVSEEDMELDPVVDLVLNASEEANKVEKAGGKKYIAVFRRILDSNPDGGAVGINLYDE